MDASATAFAATVPPVEVSCATAPCRALVENLAPATKYTFKVIIYIQYKV